MSEIRQNNIEMDLHELEMIAKSDDISNENEVKQSKKELNKKDSELES
jgi:hypothetical protein